jgi:hypothetical protein
MFFTFALLPLNSYRSQALLVLSFAVAGAEQWCNVIFLFFFLSFFLGFCFVHRSWCSRLSPPNVCFDCCLPTRNREPKRLGRNGQRSNCIERNGNRSSRAQRKTFSSDWKDRAWMICRTYITWTQRDSRCFFFIQKKENKIPLNEKKTKIQKYKKKTRKTTTTRK